MAGLLYDALAAGRVDDKRLFSLLTEVLPPLVDGPEARAWTARHGRPQAVGRAPGVSSRPLTRGRVTAIGATLPGASWQRRNARDGAVS